jgi:type I restriction enzyme S subunit
MPATPKGWTYILVGEAGAIITGNTPSTSMKNYYGGKFPFISPVDMGLSRYVKSSATTLSNEGFEQTRKLPPNAVLVVCIGSTIGKLGITFEWSATNQQINAIICKESINHEFIYYALGFIRDEIRNLAGLQAVPIVNKTTFSAIGFNCPPKKEQQKIAQILSSVDTAIENNESLVNKLTDLKKALMQELFTKGIGHKEFKDSPLGKIPKEWDSVHLFEIIEKLESGVSVNSEDRITNTNEYGVLKVSAVSYLEFRPFEHKVILPDEVQRASAHPKANRIIISRANTVEFVGACGYVEQNYPTLFLSDKLWQTEFKKDKEIEPLWLFFALCAPFMREKIKNIATGTSSSMKNISKDDFLQLQIPLPVLSEQKRIALIFKSLTDRIKCTKLKVFKYNQCKSALMQDLLSGKVRVTPSGSTN